MELEEGGETNRAVSEEKGDELEAITFGEENSLVFPKSSPKP